MGTEADAAAIGELVQDIQDLPEGTRASLNDLMIAPWTAEYTQKVYVALGVRGAAVSRAAIDTTSGERIAQAITRKAIWAADTPVPNLMADARLLGLTGTHRQRAILEAVLVSKCQLEDCRLDNGPGVQRIKKSLLWDVSQNATEDKMNSRGLNVLGCMCRTGLPYSYRHDRLIIPEEVLRSHGWQVRGFKPNCTSLSEGEVRDLVGEMQAVQSLAVVLWAVMLKTGGCGCFEVSD